MGGQVITYYEPSQKMKDLPELHSKLAPHLDLVLATAPSKPRKPKPHVSRSCLTHAVQMTALVLILQPSVQQDEGETWLECGPEIVL